MCHAQAGVRLLRDRSLQPYSFLWYNEYQVYYRDYYNFNDPIRAYPAKK